MMTAIVPMIGPMAFSTRDEKRNAREATHHIVQMREPRRKRRAATGPRTRRSIGKRLSGEDQITRPEERDPRAMLSRARNSHERHRVHERRQVFREKDLRRDGGRIRRIR